MATIEVMKALADETRVRMVSLIAAAGDLCACEIETILAVGQSNASRHLARLRAAGIVTADKRGLWVHYRLSQGPEIQRLVGAVVDAARIDTPACNDDLARLSSYRSGGYTCETIGRWAQLVVGTT